MICMYHSTDMLQLVWDRRPTYNNKSSITSSILISYLKMIYYISFACLYGLAGSMTDLVFVNSTWTFGHIHFIWRWARRHLYILYPPCNTRDLQNHFQNNKQEKDTISIRRNNSIVSLGQFRPEKDHALQIRSFARLYRQYPHLFQKKNEEEEEEKNIQLLLMGGCRCQEDKQRVEELQTLASSLGISHLVVFIINQPYSTIQKYLLQSSIGLHTMWNEHFGIGIVEMMAAGLIVIAHNSGGPKSDIILSGHTGYLACKEEEYTYWMYQAIKDGPYSESNQRIRENASKSVSRFSDETFVLKFHEILKQTKIFDE